MAGERWAWYELEEKRAANEVTKLAANEEDANEEEDRRGKLDTMTQIEKCMVDRVRMKRSSKCTDQL
jgi:hypothetical protein